MDRIGLDAKRQEMAESYARRRLLVRLITTSLSLAALAVLGPFGLAVWLRGEVQRGSGVWPVEVALFFAVLGAAFSVIELPLTYYGGYVLPHRYGLSNQTFSEWLADLLKTAGLAVVLGGISVELLYGFLRLTPDTWWIWTGIVYTLLAVVLSTLAPVLILPLFFKLQPLRDRGLEEAVYHLAERARTHIQAVREINLSSKSSAANAAVIGLGRTRKIVLGDTLLSEFPAEEVEVVVAHELGHHVHGDLPKGLALGSVLSLAGFAVANTLLHAATGRLHFAGVWDLGQFPMLAATLGVWSALTGLIDLAYSRSRESAADAYSLDLTGLGQAFVNSELRLTNQNLAWFHPPGWVELLFYTHPAPWRRVAMGERFLEEERAGA